MFSYIPKSSWFPTTVDTKQAPTIEELLKLCKAGEVERVIIPMTYYGYGSTLIDTSNLRSIQHHYSRARFQTHGYSLTMSASQFIRNEDYREMIEELQNQYPVFNEQDYSELETETKLEHLTDEVSYVLVNDEDSEVFALLPDTLAETKALVMAALLRGDWSDNIEWWEYCEIDNDGATPYSTKEQIQELAVLVSIVILESKSTDQ